MRKYDLELAVGFFIIVGILCLGYLSIRLGRSEVIGGKGYELQAIFANSGGLKIGSAIGIAGVTVGRVRKVYLDPDDYQARVIMDLPVGLNIQEDAIASIKTRGLIGEKFIEISPGGSDVILKPGERIRDTQSAVDFEELVSKFVFGQIE
jgi:phospholipid/cholesterol/gamma-HCH transport system substrate-binding protein